MKMFKRENTALVPLEEDHVPLLLEWLNDPKITQYLPIHLPMREAEEREWIRKLYTAGSVARIVFVIKAIGEEGPSSSLIGTVGIHRINWKDRDAEVGITIGESSYWRHGYGTNAMEMVVEHAFKNLNLHRLHARVYTFNEGGIALQKKVGFREEGRFREAVFKNGEYHDIISYGLLETEWENRK